jgi:inorganic pyrophosphatase
MNLWHDVAPERVTPNKFLAVIEIPKGSKCKYELDKELGVLILDRVLFTSTAYPHNYGFLPLTLAKDGDPMDVLVLCSEVMFPLSVVECIPIGVMMMKDGESEDEKIIAVAKTDPFYNGYKDISELPNHILQEIVHFFTVYKQLENKFTKVEEINGSDVARQLIAESLRRYQDYIKK